MPRHDTIPTMPCRLCRDPDPNTRSQHHLTLFRQCAGDGLRAHLTEQNHTDVASVLEWAVSLADLWHGYVHPTTGAPLAWHDARAMEADRQRAPRQRPPTTTAPQGTRQAIDRTVAAALAVSPQLDKRWIAFHAQAIEAGLFPMHGPEDGARVLEAYREFARQEPGLRSQCLHAAERLGLVIPAADIAPPVPLPSVPRMDERPPREDDEEDDTFSYHHYST